MGMSYGWEKLYTATHSLCTEGSLADRLVNALAFSLIRIKPENDLPKELREEFQEFMTDMRSTQARGDEGTIQATIDSLDELNLIKAAEKILHFYDTVCRYQEPF